MPMGRNGEGNGRKGSGTKQRRSIKSFVSKGQDSVLPSVGTSADTSVQSLAWIALSKQHMLARQKRRVV